MKSKIMLVLICLLAMPLSCATIAPSVVFQEGNQTVVQLGGARFVVPPDFEVLEAVTGIDQEKTIDSLVFMGMLKPDVTTIIVFMMQKAKSGSQFEPIDLKTEYPNAFFVDTDLKFLQSAASYITEKQMARKMYLEEPLCKVVTGYQYTDSSVRYRFDIYQNFEGEDPLKRCCRRRIKKKMLEQIKKMKTGEIELKAFRDYAFGLIKNHTQWP